MCVICDIFFCDVFVWVVVVMICFCDVIDLVCVVMFVVRRLEEDIVVEDIVVIFVGKVFIVVVCFLLVFVVWIVKDIGNVNIV